MTIWRMRIACWITKATNTNTRYVILIAFPLQQWLQERASMLRYPCLACLVAFYIDTCINGLSVYALLTLYTHLAITTGPSLIMAHTGRNM
jgi:hypothetical protein